MISSAKGDADRASLAARLVDGPKVFAPAESERRLEDWLSDLTPEQSGAIAVLTGRFPLVRAILLGLAESSPYLFDLMRADPDRALRLFHGNPEEHLAALISDISKAAESGDEAEAMQRLRSIKGEA